MHLLFNLLFLLKDLFHIERELQGCTQLYRLPSRRFRYWPCFHLPSKNTSLIVQKRPLNFFPVYRLLLNSLTCLDKQLYTAQFSTPWHHLTGLLWSLFGTLSSCILPCYTSPFMEWWRQHSHQITTWLPSLLLHFICFGTFSVALWFLTR